MEAQTHRQITRNFAQPFWPLLYFGPCISQSFPGDASAWGANRKCIHGQQRHAFAYSEQQQKSAYSVAQLSSGTQSKIPGATPLTPPLHEKELDLVSAADWLRSHLSPASARPS